MATKQDYANLSKAVYAQDKSVGKWYLQEGFKEANKEYSGFKAGVYVHADTGEVVIAIAGTDNLWGDITSYPFFNQGQASFQMQDTIALANAVKERFKGAEISFTGHSLGGLNAIYAANEFGTIGYGFNSPGFTSTEGITINPNADLNEVLTNNDLTSESGIHIGKQEWINVPINYEELLPADGGDTTSLMDYLGQIHAIDQVVDALKNAAESVSYTPGNGISIDKRLLPSWLANLFPCPDEEEESEFPDDPFENENPFDVPANVDPIILDLNKNGVQTSRVNGMAHFDYDGNGFAESTGWVNGGDGLLVMDRDGNGIIDSAKELFGDQTVLANGQKAANGFKALAELDTNKDGKIDINDEAWSQLKVWIDNGDGVSTGNELKTLDELGVKSLNLNTTISNTVDKQGNTKLNIGTFEWADGTTSEMSDYLFKTNPVKSVSNHRVDVSNEVKQFAYFPGYGVVIDIWQIMKKYYTGWQAHHNK